MLNLQSVIYMYVVSLQISYIEARQQNLSCSDNEVYNNVAWFSALVLLCPLSVQIHFTLNVTSSVLIYIPD